MELEQYEVNRETLLVEPVGKGKSKVYEGSISFVVNLSSLRIIKNSCLYFGSSYDGRREGTKSIIGVDMKVPIIIEDSRNMIFFPTASCIHEDAIWISYQNLLKYVKIDDYSSKLYFKNGQNIKVNTRYSLIDNQIIRCIKLETLLIKRKKFIENEGIVFEE